MKKYIILLAILALVVIAGLNSIYTVAENQYACTFRFSEIVNTENQPGLHFKVPFLDSVKYFPRPPSSMIFRPPM